MYNLVVVIAAIGVAFAMNFFFPGYPVGFALICAVFALIISRRPIPTEIPPTQG